MDGPGSAAVQQVRSRRLESSAVSISLWLGGVGLATLKAVAYYLSGSSLVRAGMFESLGDVASSAIMNITARKVNDNSDRHLYPTGKQRFVPIGILFFCAFMTSTMVGLAIEAVSALTHSEVEGDPGLLRRVFDEQPGVRAGLSDEKVEAIISTYQDGAAGEDSNQFLAVALLTVCAVVKGACYLWCLYVQREANSEIAKTLGADHGFDTICNAGVIVVMRAIAMLEARGYNPAWLSKIDPAASLLLSLWILWSWIDNALTQVRLLSNRRLEDQDQTDQVAKAALQHLEGSLLRLRSVDVYHCGESLEARLEVYPQRSAGAQELGVEQLSTALLELEAAVCAAGVGVHEAHAKLRHATAKQPENASWVAGYSTP